jgi:hypothetical protein
MRVSSPPPPGRSRSDELELLIREARARQRRRRLAAAAFIALLAGAAIGLNSVVGGGSSAAARAGGGPTLAVRSGNACGVRIADTRIVDAGGHTLYREPGNWAPGYPRAHVVRCSGPAIWVVWNNGAASSQQAYVGARSGDGGRHWQLVFAESYFGVNAPHELDSYMGAWTLHGPRVAYFTGTCPACGRGTVSLWVTRDGGRTFHRYRVPALTGFAPVGIRVSGDEVTIRATRFSRGVAPRKTATIRIS